MNLDYVNHLLDVLRNARDRAGFDPETARNIQMLIVGKAELSGSDLLDETIRELAYDLDFYEPDPQKRAEDYSFYDSSRAIEIVNVAIQRIEEKLRGTADAAPSKDSKT